MIKPMEREIVSMKLKKHEPKERDKKKKQERWQFF
jgi:hypothetical protein